MISNDILGILIQAKRPLSISEIRERAKADAGQVRETLHELAEQGKVFGVKGNRYAHPSVLRLTLCRARSQVNAPTFARPLDGGGDFYLDMPDETAFDGDLVFVRETQGGEKRRGTLISIVKRAHSVITGTLYAEVTAPPRRRQKRSRGRPRYVPEPRYLALIPDRRFPAQAYVTGDLRGAEDGDLCAFEIVKWPVKDGQMTVRVREALGRDDDLSAHLSALMAMHDIHEEFSADTLAEAAELGDDPRTSDINGRLDLRGEVIFTIDGADAQDFDDAVSLSEDEGGWTLGVHIADVSYYVRPGSSLDSDARERGTSVYLPGRTVPMLPEKLCNCLCSLMPDRDRLTLSAIIKLDRNLEQTSLSVRPAVIRSRARLTYKDVNELFAGRKNTVPEELHETLKRMNKLAKRMHDARVKHGSLELDVPEPDFTLNDEGYPVRMGVRARGDAQRLIEEFMLAANRAVAAHALKTELPFPYRVHEKPDSEKLGEMELTLLALGKPMKLGSVPTQSRLQKVLDAFSGTPQSSIVSGLILRSMSKARYSEKPLGHYGLAFDDYCHFTSPIRRYPDLLAHRMLRLQMKTKIGEEEALKLTQSMHTLTEEASLNEEQAAQCEREADKMMCAAFLSRNRSKELTATVTRFVKKGAFVALENSCEGLIPFKNMDDVYSVDDQNVFMIGKRTRRVIRLGDMVLVKCTQADIATGQIEFRLLEPKS